MNFDKLGKLMLVAGLFAIAVPAWAGSQIEKKLTLNPGGRFSLDSDGGGVTITGTDQPGADIVITSGRDDLESLFDIKFDESSGYASVKARRRSHWSWFSDYNLHFEVRVPKATALEINTGGGNIEVNSIASEADLKTSGGPIKVAGLNGKLRARTSGGPVRVQEIQGDADLESSGGPIEADSVDGTLLAHTSGGSIHIERVTGRVDARTSGGGITAILSKKNGHGGVLDSSGGSISVDVDPSVNLTIDASTSGGSVSSELPVRVSGTMSRESLHGSLGSGGETLSVHTSGGSIHFHPL